MAQAQANENRPTVRWDSTDLRSSACNVASARRVVGGIAIGFGAVSAGSGGELGVELLHRVHLEPAAAARLRELLVKLVADHEARFRKPE